MNDLEQSGALAVPFDALDVPIPDRPQTGLSRLGWYLRGHQQSIAIVEKLLSEGQLELAAEKLLVDLTRFTGSPKLLLQLARYYFESGQKHRVTETLRHVLANGYSFVEDVYESAKLFLKMGQTGLAIHSFRRVIEMGPADIAGASHQTLANILFARKDSDGALRHVVAALTDGQPVLRQTVQAMMHRPPAESTLRWAVDRLGEHPLSERPYLEALRLQIMGNCHLMLQEWDKATDVTSLATEIVFKKRSANFKWDSNAERLVPKFVIIGAMKSGTTSLWEQLATHPQIVSPLHKELQFFMHPGLPDSFYRAMFPRLSDPSVITGDASPGYYRTTCYKRIKELFPEIRIIFLRRDPAKRALSHYFHNIGQGISLVPLEDVYSSGLEKIRALHSLSDDDLAATLDDYWNQRIGLNSYLLLSCYDLLMRGWRKTFPAEQILTVDLDDLVRDNGPTIDRVLEFLGVEPGHCKDLKKDNAGNYRRDTPEFRLAEQKLRLFFEELDESNKRHGHH